MAEEERSQFLTDEEFEAQYMGKPFELIEGRLVELSAAVQVSPTGGKSSEIAADLLMHINLFVKEHNLGKVTASEGGYWLQPGTMRAPDIGFYGWDKYRQITKPTGYRPFPPDLAVEVVSPGDQADDIQNKVRLYIESGVKLVWVIFPEAQEALCYYPDHTVRLTIDDTLDGGDVLPGFTLPLSACFPPDPPAAKTDSAEDSDAS